MKSSNLNFIFIRIVCQLDPACHTIDTKQQCYVLDPSCQGHDTSTEAKVDLNIMCMIGWVLLAVCVLVCILCKVKKRLPCKGMYYNDGSYSVIKRNYNEL